MKKILFLGIALTALSSTAIAQNWGYAAGSNNGGYYQQRRPAYQQPVQRQHKGQPAMRSQGQPRYQQPRYQQPRQMQRYNPDTQGYYQNQNKNSGYGYSWNEGNEKRFYVSPRLGFSYLNFLDSEADMSGFGLFLSGAAGMYINENLRADVEIGYHFEREVASYKEDDVSVELNWSQMDFMVNGYYDFKNVGGSLTPFVGAGIGFFKGDCSMKISSPYGSGEGDAEGDTVLGLALAGGASYPINDMIAAEGMVRAKYLFYSGRAINLEAIFGARFSF